MELRSNELRVGNNILYLSGSIATVRGITRKGIWVIDDGFPASETSFKPIPITEEWLLKLGFSNQIDEELPEGAEFLCFFKNKIDVELTPGKMRGVQVLDITLYEDIVDENGQLALQGVYTIKNNIQYVHQLQNLYFVLTGEELTIK